MRQQLALLFALSTPLAFSADHPLLPAYPGATERSLLQMEYQPFQLPTGKVTDTEDTETVPTLSVIGDLSQHFYVVKQVSTLKIFRNYQAALVAANFKTQVVCELEACGTEWESSRLGSLLSPVGHVAGNFRNPYFLVAEGKGSKGKVHVAVYVGGSDDGSAVQQVIIEEEALETGLLTLDTGYLQNQPPPTILGNEAPYRLEDDHRLFGRYPGASIEYMEEVDFETLSIPVRLSGAGTESFRIHREQLEADVVRHFYEVENVSTLKIYKNYQAALKSLGFSIRFHCELNACGNPEQAEEVAKAMSISGNIRGFFERPYVLVAEGNSEKGRVLATFFIGSDGEDTGIQQTIVETESLQTDLIQISAESLKRALDTRGKASIYGIFFDTDKATVKPESSPALSEISTLLKKDASLRLYVVGHTDDTGALRHNVELSELRAQAVIQALVRDYQIEPARLIAKGVGPYAPEASNRSSAGKARNRRVELVSRLE